MVDGKEERHSSGSYYLDWTEDGKRKRQQVGPDAAQAYARRLSEQARLIALANGIAIVPSSDETGRAVNTAIADFVEETRLTKKKKTLYAYTKATEYFAESCQKRYLADIERIDMLRFAAFLREEKELSPRTCRNVFGNVMTFLKAQGVRGVANKGDWPRFVQEEPEIYEKHELAKLYTACDAEQRLWWDFFLMTGMREQEVMHTAWHDVNFTQGTVRVSWKAQYGWTPKAYKERTIPIPSKLQAELKEAKKRAKADCPLLFPTAGCKPKLNFLDDLKVVAKRAKLNPDHFYLHKFRATFATWHLWEGVDLRTVQDWLGHSDMESTLRYLKPSRGQAVRDKVDATFA
jgi:integrase